MAQDPLSVRVRGAFSVPIVIETIVFAWFVLLLSRALQPGFRGGNFIAATVMFGVALSLVVLVREIVIAVWLGSTPQSVVELGAPPVDEEFGQAPPWPIVVAATSTMFGAFALIVLLGIVLGITVAAWAILMVQSRLKLLPAGIGALLVGVVLPVAFAYLLNLSLWPGLLPEIVPDWIGGGMLPPL